MFDFTQPTARRRPGLTPLIDVVFLLLVFFMLASQFGRDVALPLNTSTARGQAYSGPPRLVSVTPDGTALNGISQALPDIMEALNGMLTLPSDTIILQATAGADVQRLTDVVMAFSNAGFTGLVLVEETP